MTGTEPDARGRAQAYIDAVNRRDWESAVEFLSPEVLLIDYGRGGTHRGREAWVARFKPTVEPFPDLQLEVTSLLVDGELVAQEVVGRGTHTAPLPLPTGEVVAPTGRSVEIHFAAFGQVDSDQRLAVVHFYANPMTMLAQLGMPAPAR